MCFYKNHLKRAVYVKKQKLQTRLKLKQSVMTLYVKLLTRFKITLCQ